MFRLILMLSNEEYDKDGDGKVYIISQGESVAYMDEKEYLAWGKQIFCGHNKGTFLISGLKSKLASDVKGGMCMEKLN